MIFGDGLQLRLAQRLALRLFGLDAGAVENYPLIGQLTASLAMQAPELPEVQQQLPRQRPPWPRAAP
jgi:hypothetical protein